MSEIVKTEVEKVDEDHVWIDGKQFISLNRFLQLTRATVVEIDHLKNKVQELTDNNEALETLLKLSAS